MHYFGLQPQMPVQYRPCRIIPPTNSQFCPSQGQVQIQYAPQTFVGPWRTVSTTQYDVQPAHIPQPPITVPTPQRDVQSAHIPQPPYTAPVNDELVLECAKQMYLSLGFSKSSEQILSPLQSRHLTSASDRATVFIKLFDILMHYSIVEKFSISFKERLSKYFDLLAGQFPALKLNDYFINFGPNPQPPQNADPVLLKKMEESKFAITLAQSGMKHIIKHNMPPSTLSPDNIDYISRVDFVKFEELQKYLQDFPANKSVALIITHKTKHVSLLLVQSKFGKMNFVVSESLSGMYVYPPSGQMVDSIPLQEVIDCIAQTFARKIPSKISYFRLKRQHDITLCPVFVLSDLSWCFKANIFYYVDYIEKNYPYKILRTDIPADRMITVQALPTYPGLLLTTQSVQFFAPLLGLPTRHSDQSGNSQPRVATEQFDPEFTFGILKREFFENEIRTSILEVSPQKFMNLKADMILLQYAKKILHDLLRP